MSVPIRVTTHNTSGQGNLSKWGSVPGDFADDWAPGPRARGTRMNALLCREFAIDPVRGYFDLPASARGVGARAAGGTIDGYVFFSGDPAPIGKVTILLGRGAATKFREGDPDNLNDARELGHERG